MAAHLPSQWTTRSIPWRTSYKAGPPGLAVDHLDHPVADLLPAALQSVVALQSAVDHLDHPRGGPPTGGPSSRRSSFSQWTTWTISWRTTPKKSGPPSGGPGGPPKRGGPPSGGPPSGPKTWITWSQTWTSEMINFQFSEPSGLKLARRTAPSSLGSLAQAIPAASNASNFSSAVPLPPEIIAPA